VYYVGALDPDLRVFDIVMTSPHGTTYNAYLVKGADKVALFETVKERFFDEHLAKIKEVCDPSAIDYIVANHTEPDHSGSIEKLLSFAPNATVVGTQTAIKFLKEIINRPFNHRVVTEKDKIDLGGATLEFLSVPMLHWPDSMYTYIPEKKALFTCDSFGCHYSDPRIFLEEIDADITEDYKYYFDNIIGPFAHPFFENALKRIESLEIDFIGNGHGPVPRGAQVKKVIDMARGFTQAPAKSGKSVAIIYVSAYGYTKQLAGEIAQGIRSVNSDIHIDSFDLVYDDVAKAKAAFAASDAFLLGSPTILGDALPPIWDVLLGVNPVIHKGKLAAAFGSYGWSGEAVPNLYRRMEELRLKLPLPGLKVNFKPSQEQLAQAYRYGADFAKEL
jgi:flavorubredoxin